MQEEQTPTSALERLKEAQRKKESFEALMIENKELHKNCVQKIADTEEGRIFFQNLFHACGVRAITPCNNPQQMLEDNGKRRVYIEAIFPYLTTKQVAKIEQKIETKGK